jgi:hypothetical protein
MTRRPLLTRITLCLGSCLAPDVRICAAFWRMTLAFSEDSWIS